MTSAGWQVSVFGTDSLGKPFFQTARAVNISGFEVTIEGLDRTLDVNDVVGLRHAGQKARFQVAWIGRQGTPEQGQIGLRALELDKDLFGPAARSQQPLRSHPDVAGHERRRYPRVCCSGRVEFRRRSGEDPILGRLQVLGEGGCYIETLTAAPYLTVLDLHVTADDLELRAPGVVRDFEPGMGMGVEFGEISPAHRARLQHWLSHRSGSSPTLW